MFSNENIVFTENGISNINWQEIVLSEAIEVNPKRPLKKGETAKFVGMTDLEPFQRKVSSYGKRKFKGGGAKFRNGDTLLARITPCLENGKTALVDFLEEGEIGFGSTEFIVLSAKKEKTDPFFVYYLVRSPSIRKIIIKSMTGTSGRQRVENAVFDNVTINLPSLPEQGAIGKILSDIDIKIEINRKMNQTLESMGQAVFKRWFVDFDFMNEESKPYKSSGGEMVDSELGEIPKGWKVLSNISEICDKIDYGYTQSASTEEVGPRFLRVTDINKADWINWITIPFCKIDEKDKRKYILNKKDIVIARMADPGKIAIFESDFPAVFASYLIRIRLKNPSFAYYLYYLMKSAYYQNFIEGAATGSVQKNLNAKALTTGLPIIIPDKVVFLFNSVAENLRAKINSNLVESTILSKIRDTLLPKLMSGKIKVTLSKRKEGK